MSFADPVPVVSAPPQTPRHVSAANAPQLGSNIVFEANKSHWQGRAALRGNYRGLCRRLCFTCYEGDTGAFSQCLGVKTRDHLRPAFRVPCDYAACQRSKHSLPKRWC